MKRPLSARAALAGLHGESMRLCKTLCRMKSLSRLKYCRRQLDHRNTRCIPWLKRILLPYQERLSCTLPTPQKSTITMFFTLRHDFVRWWKNIWSPGAKHSSKTAKKPPSCALITILSSSVCMSLNALPLFKNGNWSHQASLRDLWRLKAPKRIRDDQELLSLVDKTNRRDTDRARILRRIRKPSFLWRTLRYPKMRRGKRLRVSAPPSSAASWMRPYITSQHIYRKSSSHMDKVSRSLTEQVTLTSTKSSKGDTQATTPGHTLIHLGRALKSMTRRKTGN